MSPRDPVEQPERLRRLVERGAQVRPFEAPERAALLALVKRRAARQAAASTRPFRAALALALLAWAGVALLTARNAQGPDMAASSAVQQVDPPHADPNAVAMPRGGRRLALGGRGEVVLEDHAVVRVIAEPTRGSPGPVRLALERARLTASVGPRRGDEPVSIVTPQVTVVVIGTHFTVAVDGHVTTVSVAHGRVRVDCGARSVFVDGGAVLRSDDARLAPEPAPPPAPRPVVGEPACARHPDGRGQGRGGDLAAENALFARALRAHGRRRDPDAALALLRSYECRFPRGVLRQEVAYTVVRILREQGRLGDACRQARRYARRFQDEKLVGARLRAQCEVPLAPR